MDDKQPLSRRARYRIETQEEAKEIALRQLAQGGLEAVSLMAIGKEMGISGPALYRYFANRDALLNALVVDAYSDLAAAVTATAQENETALAQDQLRSLADCLRTWAVAQPHRYLLIYGTPVPGYTAPDNTVSLARRILTPFIEGLAALSASKAIAGSRRAELETQLSQWLIATGQDTTDGPLMRQGLVWWTRLHGMISLEIEGHFATMGFDPALFYDSEVETLLDSK